MDFKIRDTARGSHPRMEQEGDLQKQGGKRYGNLNPHGCDCAVNWPPKSTVCSSKGSSLPSLFLPLQLVIGSFKFSKHLLLIGLLAVNLHYDHLRRPKGNRGLDVIQLVFIKACCQTGDSCL